MKGKILKGFMILTMTLLMAVTALANNVPTVESPFMIAEFNYLTPNQGAYCNAGSITDADADTTFNIYAIKKNGNYIKDLYFTFEQDGTTYNGTDYAGGDNNITGIYGSVTYSNNSGFTNIFGGGDGAYLFNGDGSPANDGGLNVSGYLSNFSTSDGFAFMAKTRHNHTGSTSSVRTILSASDPQKTLNFTFTINNDQFINVSVNDVSYSTNVGNISDEGFGGFNNQLGFAYNQRKNRLSLYSQGTEWFYYDFYHNLENLTNIIIGDNPNIDGDGFRGIIDDVSFYNIPISSSEFTYPLWSEDNYVSKYLMEIGDTWECDHYASDFKSVSLKNTSNQLIVINSVPTLTSVLLNTTSGGNWSEANITLNRLVSEDIDLDPLKEIIDWQVKGRGDPSFSSIHTINMPMEGGSNSTFVKDYSDNSNNGVVVGATRLYEGLLRGYDDFSGYRFDGMDDYINISNPQINNEFTINYWENCENTLVAMEKTIMEKEGVFRVWHDASNNHWVTIYTNNASYNLSAGLGMTQFNTNMRTITFDGSTLKSIGNAEIESSLTVGAGEVLATNSNPLYIGGDPSDPTSYYEGIIDDFEIFKRVISNETIDQIWERNYYTIGYPESSLGDYWRANVWITDGVNVSSNITSNEIGLISTNKSSFISENAFGLVNFTDLITSYEDDDMLSAISVIDGVISVNVTLIPDLQVPATLTFKNSILSGKTLLRNGLEAFGTTSQQVGDDIVVNTLGFSSYQFVSSSWSNYTRTTTMLNGVNLTKKYDGVGIYQFETDNTVEDLSIYANDGLKATGVTYSSTGGVDNSGYYDFSGGGYVQLTNDGNIIPTTMESNSFTISMSLQGGDATSRTLITDNSGNYFQLTDNDHRLVLKNSTGTSGIIITIPRSTSLPNGVWYDYALKFNGTHFCGYIDAVQDGCVAYDQGLDWGTLTTLSRSVASANWIGYMDNVHIYDRVLTDAEILARNNTNDIYKYLQVGEATSPCITYNISSEGFNMTFPIDGDSSNVKLYYRTASNCGAISGASWQLADQADNVFSKQTLSSTHTGFEAKVQINESTNQTLSLGVPQVINIFNVASPGQSGDAVVNSIKDDSIEGLSQLLKIATVGVAVAIMMLLGGLITNRFKGDQIKVIWFVIGLVVLVIVIALMVSLVAGI